MLETQTLGWPTNRPERPRKVSSMHTLSRTEFALRPGPMGDLSSLALVRILLHTWRTGQKHPELLSRRGTLQDVQLELLRRERLGVEVQP
jgi:hypothetical protein